MLGAIAGDIIGSVFEFAPVKSKSFPLFSPASTFTDDSVLTVATAQVLLEGGDYASAYREYFNLHPGRGFGEGFHRWAQNPHPEPYFSFGNGSAMRVSPVAWARGTLEEVQREARRSAEVTHNHEQGVRGAMAVASAIFLARSGAGKADIRSYMEARFGYNLAQTLEQIRPDYGFDVSCEGSVPQSIIAFLESVDYEDAVRNAVSLGGDSDTMACMAGAIAEAFYGGVPAPIRFELERRLPDPLRVTVTRFTDRFNPVPLEGASPGMHSAALNPSKSVC